MLRQKIFDKNGVIWCNLGRPKVCCYQHKNQQFEGKNQEENIAIFSSPTNADEQVSMKIKTFIIYKRGLGG